VPEDEGQHLQDVYPTAGRLGGAGRFALNPESHRTEHSPLVNDESRERLLASWGRYWDDSKRVLVEKSPPNVISARFLRALFPSSRFVMVVRHPIPVALATRRWKPTPNDLDLLVRHWVVAHEIMLEDAQRIGGVAIVRYEDTMAAPAEEIGKLYAFLGLAPHEGRYQVRQGLNESYLNQWRAPWRLVRRWRTSRIAAKYEDRVAAFGYSLQDPERLEPATAAVRAFAPESVTSVHRNGNGVP
jgi:hypothetical protein